MNVYRVSGISAEGKKSGYVDVTASNMHDAVGTALTEFGFTPVNLTVMFLKSADN